jgi:hypothetical protein
LEGRKLLRIFTVLLKQMVMKQLVRFFKCELTGDKLAIIWDGKQEICVTEDEGWDVYALSMAEYDRRHLVSEMY